MHKLVTLVKNTSVKLRILKSTAQDIIYLFKQEANGETEKSSFRQSLMKNKQK